MPYMRFLFVRPGLCPPGLFPSPDIRLPSDSASRRTPLPSANAPYCPARSGLPPPSCCPCRAHIRKRIDLGWSILLPITWVILETMLRCSAVYLVGTYGATGGARANALPLPYCAGHGTIFAGESPATDIYRQCSKPQAAVSNDRRGGSGVAKSRSLRTET